MPSLTRHPSSPRPPVEEMAANAARRGGVLEIRFELRGRVHDLLLPPTAGAGRTDELWRHTCFEAFVQAAKGPGYLELNLSPSTQWAAYRFDSYRQAMRPAEAAPSHIEVAVTDEGVELSATIDLAGSGLDLDAPWRVGLSAVIEDGGGGISYWALAHPEGKPDFHHRDCFALELPAPEAP